MLFILTLIVSKRSQVKNMDIYKLSFGWRIGDYMVRTGIVLDASKLGYEEFGVRVVHAWLPLSPDLVFVQVCLFSHYINIFGGCLTNVDAIVSPTSIAKMVLMGRGAQASKQKACTLVFWVLANWVVITQWAK